MLEEILILDVLIIKLN